MTKKLKIKTITCHNVYNFGATLQAYALMKYLQNLGHDVEVIDYRPEYLSFNLFRIGKRWNKNILLKSLYYLYVVPKRIILKKRRQKFDIFTAKYLHLTPKTYYSYMELFKEPPYSDIYFAGSDQIWNTFMPNGSDPAFYLDFAPENTIKASYAASFSSSKLNKELEEFVKSRLKKLNFISVREETGVKILNELGITSGVVVVDPVFLLDKSIWEEFANYNSSKRYILVYDQENNKYIKQTAKKIAKQFNLQIIAIESLYPRFYANKRVIDAGPEEFLGLIKNCEICLTNSFHCVAFSLIFEKNFFVFKRMYQEVNSRLIDLLDYLSLSDRIINGGLEKMSFNAINYERINELLELKKKKSITYINNVLFARMNDK